jgi:phenylacetate-CoA ligase
MGLKKSEQKIIPASGGMTQRQIKLMKDLGATILACTPSFAVYLAETNGSRRHRP